MAGNYPDYPSWRMAIDKDGTQGFVFQNGVITDISSGNMALINNEAEDTYAWFTGSTARWFVLLFPELRDLDAFWVSVTANNTFSLSNFGVSVDTTNGIDGTWTSIATAYDLDTAAKPAYRTGIDSSTVLAVRGFRFMGVGNGSASSWIKNVHLFGEVAPGENPQRLMLWHPTLDQHVGPAHFDWGNVPRSGSADVQFRVKNMHGSLTANDIRVAMDVLTDGSPSVPAQHSLSEDGSTFLAQVNIGSLGPGGISPILTLRRITPSNAQLGLWSFRVFADSDGGWS